MLIFFHLNLIYRNFNYKILSLLLHSINFFIDFTLHNDNFSINFIVFQLYINIDPAISPAITIG